MKKDNKLLSNTIDSDESKETNPVLSAKPDGFTIRRLFFIWLQIGSTSFGGGAITQYLIQEQFIYKHKWITDEEYANIIAMSQISPGINILAYTILIGNRLSGWTGVFVSLMGLILPSAAITIGISAIYVSVNKFSRVQSGLHTVFAAIVGISLATNWRNVKPILANNRKRGPLAFGTVLGIMIASAIIYILLNPSVVVLYLLGGLSGAFLYWYISRKSRRINK